MPLGVDISKVETIFFLQFKIYFSLKWFLIWAKYQFEINSFLVKKINVICAWPWNGYWKTEKFQLFIMIMTANYLSDISSINYQWINLSEILLIACVYFYWFVNSLFAMEGIYVTWYLKTRSKYQFFECVFWKMKIFFYGASMIKIPAI